MNKYIFYLIFKVKIDNLQCISHIRMLNSLGKQHLTSFTEVLLAYTS